MIAIARLCAEESEGTNQFTCVGLRGGLRPQAFIHDVRPLRPLAQKVSQMAGSVLAPPRLSTSPSLPPEPPE